MVTKELVEREKPVEWEFLEKVEGSLLISNDKVLKWYGTVIQCIFQYHPKNLVQHFKEIEQIINLLMREWENQAYLELALDILYNTLLCLCKTHFSAKEFSKKGNMDYKTLNIEYLELKPEEKELIDYIYQRYYLNIKTYLENKHGQQLRKEGSEGQILGNFENFHEQNHNNDTIRIRRRNLKLVDFVLMPRLSKAEEVHEKKLIYRCLSIQYTIMSALMFKAPFHAKL